MKIVKTIFGAAVVALALGCPAHAVKDWNRTRYHLMEMARGGQAERAYAEAMAVRGPDAWDARFVAGYIALRRLNRPDLAATRFAETALLASDAYGKSTSGFWLGRALAAAGRPDDAVKAMSAAARWPHTFYGITAAARLGIRPAIATDPRAVFGQVDVTEALASPQGRAIVQAQASGDIDGRNAALRRLAAGGVKDKAIACTIANHVGATGIAVDIARAAARTGVALVECGWPQVHYAWHDSRAPKELVLAVSREESSFRQNATSSAGAKGSMQVTDVAALDVGRKAGVTINLAMIGQSADYNVAVGSYYLGGLLKKYGHPVLAIAAYNAGPQRVDQWLSEFGDPRTSQVDICDFIEDGIAFAETRAYVKRVMASYILYLTNRKK